MLPTVRHPANSSAETRRLVSCRTERRWAVALMQREICRPAPGEPEYRYTGRDVEQGDIIWHDGEHWTVLAVVSNDGGPQTASVEPNSDGLIDKLQSEKEAIELESLLD
jgi:hypothetical protein